MDARSEGHIPVSPPPLRVPKPQHLPAYLSNGLLGLRVGRIPFVEGLAIVSGLRGLDPVHRLEAFARGPYPLSADIEIDGQVLSRSPASVRFVEQSYDFSCGELRTQLEFRTEKVVATVSVLNLCSRSLPMAVQQEITVDVDRACDLKLSAGVSHAGVPGQIVAREVRRIGDSDSIAHGVLLFEPHGGLSRCGASYVTQLVGAESAEESREAHNDLAPIATSYSLRARSGRHYRLRQISVLVPSAMHHEPDRQALRLVSIGYNRGFDNLRQANADAWRELWRGRIQLLGASSRWQAAADASFYYLHASAHPSSLFSTAMFGLAYWPNHNYYFGHVMWDIETFALPPLLLTAPETARALLDYRFKRMDAAHRNAAMQGYAGILFPWESSAEYGEEATPPEGPLLGMEQHVNLSVALGFARFCHATGDREFESHKAWPVLNGVARWIASRVTETSRGFEIKNTIGVAENRPGTVDNNAYVNVTTRVVLEEAVALGQRLGYNTSTWDDIACRIFVPMIGRSKVIANHDSFTSHESGVAGATPEALAGLFPTGFRPPADVEEATVSFYLDRVEQYIGYPMLSALLGVFAAYLGDRARSLEYFNAGYLEFLTEPFYEANEFSNDRFPDKPRVGPLFANVGGFLTSLLYGLPRLQLGSGSTETWLQGPVIMPKGWSGIAVDRLWIRGRRMSLLAQQGQTLAELRPLDSTGE